MTLLSKSNGESLKASDLSTPRVELQREAESWTCPGSEPVYRGVVHSPEAAVKVPLVALAVGEAGTGGLGPTDTATV